MDDEKDYKNLIEINARIKASENSYDLLLALDRLTFAAREKNVVSKIKTASTTLQQVKSKVPDDLQEEWGKLLTQQIRWSVDRAKKVQDNKK